MPAAAVIPAPIAYIKAVAVKKLVVGSRARVLVRFAASTSYPPPSCRRPRCTSLCDVLCDGKFTLKKLECSKQALA